MSSTLLPKSQMPPRSSTTIGKRVIFDDVVFLSDTTYFTLGRGDALWSQSAPMMSPAGNKCSPSYIGTGTIQSRIYPNPTLGTYSLEVSGAKWVKVVIFNNLGSVVSTKEDTGKNHYVFSGSLPTGSIYYVSITTDGGSQTTKLVVE